MFRKLVKNKRAQNTAEYAILISLVVAGIIAMQTYAQRALQAKVRDASKFMSDSIDEHAAGGEFGNRTKQYEPYYLTQNYIVARDETSTEIQKLNVVGMETDSTTNRKVGGFQEQSYNATFGLVANAL